MTVTRIIIEEAKVRVGGRWQRAAPDKQCSSHNYVASTTHTNTHIIGQLGASKPSSRKTPTGHCGTCIPLFFRGRLFAPQTSWTQTASRYRYLQAENRPRKRLAMSTQVHQWATWQSKTQPRFRSIKGKLAQQPCQLLQALAIEPPRLGCRIITTHGLITRRTVKIRPWHTATFPNVH